jgi:hypothetical protein
MRPLFNSVRAVMARRILVNFRVRPDVVAPLLPPPFRPKLVHGWALAGICLIRLEDMRPRWVPRFLGQASENAAHRIAVEWTADGVAHEGVFIPRRDTNSLLNRIAGGRLFPGVHHPARIHCEAGGGRYELTLRSKDDVASVHVIVREAREWPRGSVFGSLAEATAFFRGGCGGWSPAPGGCGLEGVELHTTDWTMHPLAVERAESSFFADPRRFPPGTVELDSALLMRGIAHEWHALGAFNGRNGHHAPPAHHHRLAALFEMP